MKSAAAFQARTARSGILFYFGQLPVPAGAKLAAWNNAGFGWPNIVATGWRLVTGLVLR